MKIINSVLQWIVQIIHLRKPQQHQLWNAEKKAKAFLSIRAILHNTSKKKNLPFNNTFEQYQENFSVFGKHEHKASIAGNMREIPEY